MTNQILSFTEYRTIQAEEYIEDGYGSISNRKDEDGLPENIKAYEWNKKNYKGASGNCPFCNINMISRIKKKQVSKMIPYGNVRNVDGGKSKESLKVVGLSMM